jgi:exonuclease III
VHKSIVRRVVKKFVCDDKIIAPNLKAEPVNIFIVQVYMPTSEYEDNKVEEFYDIIEEILEEDRKGETNTIIMRDWNSVIGGKSDRNTVGPHARKRETREVKCS